MRQRSIGEVLRLARENQGWNFVDMQKTTRIHAKYLQALENNDFAAIPDQDYIPGYLEQYARALDLDADVLLKAYKDNSLVAFYSSKDEEEMLSELSRSYKVKKRKTSYLPLVYLLLSSLFILIFVGYIVHSRIQHQNKGSKTTVPSYSVVSKESSTTTTEETNSSSSETTPSSSSTVAGDVAVAVTGSGESLVVTVTGASFPVEVVLTGTNTTSWVNATNTSLAGGATLTPENPTAKTTMENGVTSTYITLGVVKGVALQVAGKQVDLSGLTAPSGYITINVQ